MNGPIFVLSTARSGSTLLRIVIDTHPQIYGPGELELGSLAFELSNSIASLEGTEEVPLTQNPVVLERVRSMLGDLLLGYTKRRGKAIWCEKSPNNVPYGELLAKVFPDARFICLYRHSHDVAHSILDTYRYGFPVGAQEYIIQSPGDLSQAALKYWADNTAGALKLERLLPGRTFRIRYEDLVSNPAGTLEPMFRFLDLDWDPELLRAVFTTPHDRGHGDPYVTFTNRIRKDSVGAGRNLPTDRLSAEVRERVLSLLDLLGYPERPERLAAAPEREERPSAPAPQSAERPAPAAGGEETPKTPEVRWLFETMLPARAAGERPRVPIACDIVVHGSGGGAWTVRWDDRGFAVSPGADGLPAQIEIEETDLLSIVGGANPAKVAEEGRISVGGFSGQDALRGLLQLFMPPG